MPSGIQDRITATVPEIARSGGSANGRDVSSAQPARRVGALIGTRERPLFASPGGGVVWVSGFPNISTLVEL